MVARRTPSARRRREAGEGEEFGCSSVNASLRRMKTALFVLTVSSLAISCAPASSPPPPAAAAAPATSAPAPSGEAFAKFVDDFFDAAVRLSRRRGDRRRLPPVRREARGPLAGRDRSADRGARSRCSRASRRSTARELSFDDADRRRRRSTARSAAELLDLETLRELGEEPDALCGPARRRRRRPDEARLRAGGRAARARSSPAMQTVPALYEAGKANLKNPPAEFTDLAIRMAKGSVGFFAGIAGELGQGRRRRRRGAAPLSSRRPTAPSSPRPADFADVAGEGPAAALEGDLRDRRRRTSSRSSSTTSWSSCRSPQLLARGEAQLEKDYAAFVATAKQIDPSKTPAAGHEVALRRPPDAPRT